MASDHDEFRRAVRDVRPLAHRKRAELRREAPAPLPQQRRRDEAAALAESLHGPLAPEDALETGEELSYLRAGLARDTLKKLRRGQWVIQDALDLHGLTRPEAAAAVAEFLDAGRARGLRCVRIVHGKGLGILKAKLGKWLPRRDDVLAFCQAPPRDGGGGALLVLLKSRR
jgi:DNA-nicking Smr family endonuclease